MFFLAADLRIAVFAVRYYNGYQRKSVRCRKDGVIGNMSDFKIIQEKDQKADKRRMNPGKPILLEKKGYDMSMRYHPVQGFQGRAEPLGSIYDVIQMRHVQFGECSEVTKADINGEQKQDDPVIFYETFGGSDQEDKLLNVYRQSCTFAGNTICIIGLNIKVNDRSVLNSSGLPDIASLKGKLESALQDFHKAYIIPFVWTDTNDRGGYTFPYFEVRSKLMEEAETLSEGYQYCLYRWIDRDAENDTTDQVIHRRESSIDIRRMAGMKTSSGKDVPIYITGAYNWETTEVPGAAELFLEMDHTAFRRKLNQARIALRRGQVQNKTFLQLLTELRIIDGGVLPADWRVSDIEQQLNKIDWDKTQFQDQYRESVMQKLIRELNDKERRLRKEFFELRRRVKYPDGNRPRFYLPESLMLMNPEAHRKMLANLQVSALRADAANSGQARESLAAFDPNDWKKVVFRSDFSVTKPNKVIGGHEYLHKLRELIQEGFTKEFLCTQLTSLRQSAFDNRDWAFVSGQSGTWNINGVYSPAPAEGDLEPSQAQAGLNAVRSALAGEMYDNVREDILKACSASGRR